jgi:hypothetical protein
LSVSHRIGGQFGGDDASYCSFHAERFEYLSDKITGSTNRSR